MIKSRLHDDTVQSPAQVHIKDSLDAFLNDLSDEISLLRLLLPGGNHVFKMKNVTLSGERQANGEAVIMAPQDCGIKKMNGWPGGMATLCNVHYYFEDVDFSRVRKMPGTNVAWVGCNAAVGSPTAPIYISHDGSLADHRFLISSLYDGFKKVDGCSQSDDPWFEGAIACDKAEVKIARLIIWTSSSKGFTGIE